MGKFGPALALIFAASAAAADCPPGTAELRTVTGSVMRFSVEIADDEGERAQGLMNRPAMATSSGMLFAYQAPKHAYFWMKNTLIPLDMIFMDASGLVTHVHPNAIPGDETAIDGGPDVTYVLEINGGLAKRLGLAEGAVMRSDILDQTTASWSCTD